MDGRNDAINDTYEIDVSSLGEERTALSIYPTVRENLFLLFSFPLHPPSET